MDYAEMINMMTEQLKGIYANSPRKSYENLDSSFFEWEVETNFTPISYREVKEKIESQKNESLDRTVSR